MKTSELQGAALDWTVAKCEGKSVRIMSGVCYDADLLDMEVDGDTRLIYAADWSQAGPIIERESISIERKHDGWWMASYKYHYADDPMYLVLANTPLIAAMRCYCCARLGDEIDIPEELCQQQSS